MDHVNSLEGNINIKDVIENDRSNSRDDKTDHFQIIDEDEKNNKHLIDVVVKIIVKHNFKHNEHNY